MKKIILLVVVLFLVGCTTTEPLRVITKPTEKTQLQINTPAPLSLEKVEWVIVTEKNVDSVWEELKKRKKGVVLFALREKDYKILSLNIAEIKSNLGEYISVLNKYKEYYEGEE